MTGACFVLLSEDRPKGKAAQADENTQQSRLLFELSNVGVFLLEHLSVRLAVLLGLRDLRLLFVVVCLHRETVGDLDR